MRRLAALSVALDTCKGVDGAAEAQIAALHHYLAEAPPADAAWAVYFLAGGRVPRSATTAVLRSAATQAAGLPGWLFDASHQTVGDLAETIAHFLPPPTALSDLGLAAWLCTRLLPMRALPPEAKAGALAAWWDELDSDGRWLLVKLVDGGWRAGVEPARLYLALATHAGIDARQVAERMTGYVAAGRLPDAARLAAVLAPDAAAPGARGGLPYPFFHPWSLPEGPPIDETTRGPLADWLVEWTRDGLRCQLVRRDGQAWIWSDDEQPITRYFPEVAAAAAALPDGTVLDGVLLAWREGQPAPLALVQQRLGRRVLQRRLLIEAPVSFLASDLLEADDRDWRASTLQQRRERLEALLALALPRLPLADAPALGLSPPLCAADWPDLAAWHQASRAQHARGLTLRHRRAVYGTGRALVDDRCWNWPVAPRTVCAVLVYARSVQGRPAAGQVDYAFAVWNRAPVNDEEVERMIEALRQGQPPETGGLQLVTIASANSGLRDDEFRDLDHEIRASTIQKFGPVRSLCPRLVIELAFDDMVTSRRHKSGLSLRGPRMLRIRRDMSPCDIGEVSALRAGFSSP